MKLSAKFKLGTVKMTLELSREEVNKLRWMPGDAIQPYKTAEGHVLLKNMHLEIREAKDELQRRVQTDGSRTD